MNQAQGTTNRPAGQIDLAQIVEAIAAGDRQREGELVSLLTPGLRFVLSRKLQPQDLHDALQDVLITLLENVRAGKLANAAAIPAYVRTVAIRYVYEKFTEYKQDRRNQGMEACERMKSCSDSAEDIMVSAERRDLAVKALRGLPSLQREILYRLYVCQQSKDEIISATGITETQYRLNKSRGKAALMDRVSRSSRAIPAASKLAGKAAVCLSKLGMPIGAYGSVA